MKERLILADEHVVFRESLRLLLEREGFEVVGEAATGKEAAWLVRQLNPDVAILDLHMPVRNGIEAAREIHRRSPRTATILLTMFDEDMYVLKALQAHVRGYVLKSQAASDLVKAIQEVSRGRPYLSPRISRVVVEACLARKPIYKDSLTNRERHILQLIAEGKSMKEAAEILEVSHRTAELHRFHIMQKLTLHNTAGLVRYAVRHGLIDILGR